MSRVRTATGTARRASASGPTRSSRELMGALRDIAASEQPAVGLSSLARASNPSFSDACAIELSEGTEPPFRVCFPMPDETRLPTGARPVEDAVGAPETT
jgi:hypothetical protein